jgi:hypothetical protein
VIFRPYATSPIALRVGPGKKDYYVASGLLQNPGWIDSAIWGKIRLPDVDEHTGHVLAHFLCTGTYQTLYDIEVSPEEETRFEFKRAFSAFVTAETYKLTGLQRLAMQNIEQYGERMTIFDIVHTIDEDFSRLLDSTTEFQRYLKAKARDAFQKDHNDFYNNGVFDRISNIALSKVLAKCVMKLYEDKITHMIQAERSTYGFPTKHDAMTEGDMDGEKKGSGDGYWDTEGVDSQSKKPKLEKGLATSKAFNNDNGKSEEEATAVEGFAEPVELAATISESVPEVPAVDPLAGLTKLQKKKLKKKMEEEAVAKAIEDAKQAKTDEDAAKLKRIEDEETELERLEYEDVERQRLESEAAAAAETEKKKQEVSWGDNAWCFSTKEKKKKGANDELPPPPAEPELELGPIVEPEPVPEPEPVVEEDPWATFIFTTKKKKKKGSKEESTPLPPPPPPESEVILNHEPILPPEPPADEWSDWGAPVAKKKKKSKKGAAVVIQDPDPILEDCILADPLPSDPVPSPELEAESAKSAKDKESSDWGLSTIWVAGSKKKKKGNSADDEPPPVQESDAVEEPRFNDVDYGSALSWSKGSSCKSDVPVVVENSTESVQNPHDDDNDLWDAEESERKHADEIAEIEVAEAAQKGDWESSIWGPSKKKESTKDRKARKKREFKKAEAAAQSAQEEQDRLAQEEAGVARATACGEEPRLKPTQDPVNEPPPLLAEPFAELTADNDLLDFVKNVPEDELLAEFGDQVPAKKEEAASGWGSASGISLRSTNKTEPRMEESVIFESESEPEQPVEKTLIKSSKKKKKSSKKDEAVGEQVSANSSKFSPKIMARPESSGEKESSAKAATRICPHHFEHLFHGEGWKDCGICWTWLSQVTTQFTRARRVDDDGYKIV